MRTISDRILGEEKPNIILVETLIIFKMEPKTINEKEIQVFLRFKNKYPNAILNLLRLIHTPKIIVAEIRRKSDTMNMYATSSNLLFTPYKQFSL